MKVLVLGGTGFIGRHIAIALIAQAHEVIIGTRHPGRTDKQLPEPLRGCAKRPARFERLSTQTAWEALIRDVDVVVNCVGILRERSGESYEQVHHRAPAALAGACARLSSKRLIHVSALGLCDDAKSGFLISKLRGEGAIK